MQSEMKICPFCAEEIKLDALKCRYCGEFLEKKPDTKWYLKTNLLVISFLVVGPFALPLLWINPVFSRNKKIVISIIVLILSYFIASFLSDALKSITEYYQILNQQF